jgi:hypothetical protein
MMKVIIDHHLDHEETLAQVCIFNWMTSSFNRLAKRRDVLWKYEPIVFIKSLVSGTI